MKKKNSGYSGNLHITLLIKIIASIAVVAVLFLFVMALFYSYYNDGAEALVDLMKNS